MFAKSNLRLSILFQAFLVYYYYNNSLNSGINNIRFLI